MTFETHAPLLTSALVSISTGQQAWADAGPDRAGTLSRSNPKGVYVPVNGV
jgi:hypothetical protein